MGVGARVTGLLWLRQPETGAQLADVLLGRKWGPAAGAGDDAVAGIGHGLESVPKAPREHPTLPSRDATHSCLTENL